MIYPIVAYGSPVLKKRAEDISREEVDVKALAEDMFETMYNANGIGLAGPQIGKSLRIFVVDGQPTEEEGMENFKKVFVNPEIIEEEGEEWDMEEGCLSIPGIREDVARQEQVHIKYYDENWEPHEETYDGMKARVIQHEYDHLEGILFTDYLTPFRKRMLKSKLTNITKGQVKVDYSMKFPQRR